MIKDNILATLTTVMAPIEVETGPMFCGKTEELIKDINRRIIGKQIQGEDFLVFSHSEDTRYGEGVLASHSGQKVEAITLTGSFDLLEFLIDLPAESEPILPTHIKPEYLLLKAIYVDEGQFFDDRLGEILTLIDNLFLFHPERDEPIEIRVAGLDMDFRGEPFDPMPDIMARAVRVNKHTAVCTEKGCGKNTATMTQRFVDGEPADYFDPVIVVGADEKYEARCPGHHRLLRKPHLTRGI